MLNFFVVLKGSFGYSIENFQSALVMNKIELSEWTKIYFARIFKTFLTFLL